MLIPIASRVADSIAHSGAIRGAVQAFSGEGQSASFADVLASLDSASTSDATEEIQADAASFATKIANLKNRVRQSAGLAHDTKIEFQLDAHGEIRVTHPTDAKSRQAIQRVLQEDAILRSDVQRLLSIAN
ncbi:MAG: hypothetical protein AAFP90_03875 [Planctomycetota bacterium]